ncbi:hypothetical protein C8F04DRAFT_1400976 [Mycena alexandri]|uniref:Uncharacterized protein n=1 Tax=Mycena alexandri TaxID=1745969 RepID=A0AAD6SBB7_9AGAR|nr:hypothetical protein C8F04DRAFT_1400976 [Mycena alexandri]
MLRAATPVRLLRAFKAAEAGNEHDESRIEQSTRGGDRSSQELALPARMGNVSPAGWVKTAYDQDEARCTLTPRSGPRSTSLPTPPPSLHQV